jgi:hypothetical protein
VPLQASRALAASLRRNWSGPIKAIDKVSDPMDSGDDASIDEYVFEFMNVLLPVDCDVAFGLVRN